MNTLATVTTQVAEANSGLTMEAFLATILYTLLGIAILVFSVFVINKAFGFSVKHELVKDNNVAVGVVVAGIAIAIAIIIAATISS